MEKPSPPDALRSDALRLAIEDGSAGIPLPPDALRLAMEVPPPTIRTRAVEAVLQFYVLERQCKIAQNALGSELKELEDMMDKETEGLDEHGLDGFYSFINDEYIEVAETLPLIQWYSQFLLSYSFFEKALNDICTAFQKDLGYSLSFKDLSGQGISRAKNYLFKVCGVSSPFDIPEWHTAKVFGDVRNAIAHRAGFIDCLPERKDSLFFQLSKRSDVDLKTEVMDQEDAQISFGVEFLLGAIAVFRSIISAIGLSVRTTSEGELGGGK